MVLALHLVASPFEDSESLLYDAVSAYVMIFVQKMGESESGFSFAFGSQPFGKFIEI